MTKAEIRQKVWQTIQREGAARFPGALGRVPNFAGAERAAQLLREMAVWRRALVVKVNPDAPQLPVRRLALAEGKILYMAVPRLRTEKCFVEIDPQRLGKKAALAASIAGACRWGRAVSPREMRPVDLVVCGSVAVGRDGARLGKGGGYCDLAVGWVFFPLSALLPMLQRRRLEMQRLQFLRGWERRTKHRLIALIHRQETLSFIGFPLVRYIDIQDSEEVLRALRLTAEDIPIDIVLHTPAGLALAAAQIAHPIGARKGKVTVYVPHYAMSGGTLIALAADEIVMDPNAVLGSLDPQLGQHPAASIVRAIEWKTERNQEVDDETVILADVARKAIVQLRECVRGILGPRLGPEKAEELATILPRGEWTHDHPLDVEA